MLIGVLILFLLVSAACLYRQLAMRPSTRISQDPLPVRPGRCTILTEFAVNWSGFDLREQPVNRTASFTTFSAFFRARGIASKVEARAALQHAAGIVSQDVFGALQAWLDAPRPFAEIDLISVDYWVSGRLGVPQERALTRWPGRPWFRRTENQSQQTLCVLPGTPPGTYAVEFGKGMFVTDRAYLVRDAILSASVVVGR